MGRTSTKSLRGTETTHVFWTSIATTGLQKKVLSPSRCITVRRGRRTLAGGKTPYTNASQTTKTHFTPHSVLLGHIYTNRKKLRHLRKGAASRDESPCTLETIPRLDKRTICNHDRSCKPTILEITQEPKSVNSVMASRPARVQLRNMTYSWQREHSPQCALAPSWSQPREKQ